MKIFGAPNRYFQGDGILNQVGETLAPVADRFFIFADDVVLSLVGDRIVGSLERNKKTAIVETFGGECCYPEIHRLRSKAEKEGAQAIIGIGGGKAMDTAKALNIQLNLPLVIVPTIASTDAPTSNLAVIYEENHVKKEVIWMKPCTSTIIFVDTGVIAQAPKRFLVAGMGDAMATKFEAEACWKAGGLNLFKGKPCRGALQFAHLAYEVIRQFGEEAKASVEKKQVSPAVEEVVEANILLSGLGFESGGLAAAHAIHGGFTHIEEMNQSLHGEKVAFGLLAQFVLEKREPQFMSDIISFYRRIGLPTSLRELGLEHLDMGKMEKAVDMVLVAGSFVYNMPFPIERKMVMDAILQADFLGR
jgi:glycerol dehydrogenase